MYHIIHEQHGSIAKAVADPRRALPLPTRIRQQLARCARDKKLRTHQFSHTRPVEWRPQTVVNPESDIDLTFTPAGAWEFIAKVLEEGHEVEEVDLDQPPGCKGYMLLISGGAGNPQIYIKLELVGNKVHCRSFHYSTH